MLRLFTHFFKLLMTHKKGNPRKTVLVIAIGFAVLYIVFGSLWMLGVAVLAVLVLPSLYLSRKLELLWLTIGEILGWVISPIVLSLVFFCFLLPLAMITRLIRREDSMMLKNGYKSTFKAVNKTFAPDSFEKMW